MVQTLSLIHKIINRIVDRFLNEKKKCSITSCDMNLLHVSNIYITDDVIQFKFLMFTLNNAILYISYTV